MVICLTHRPQNVSNVFALKLKMGSGGIGGLVTNSAEHMVPELIPVLGSQPAGAMSHKPGGRLPLLSARPTLLNRCYINIFIISAC